MALVWLVTKKSATWWYQNKSFCLVWVACTCTLKSEPEAWLLHVHDRLCYNNSEAVHAIIIAKPFNPFPATHDFRRLLFLMVFVRMLPIMRTIWTKIRIQKKTCVKRPLSKIQQIDFQDQLSLNADQKYCKMLQGEHSDILSTFIKLPFVIKIFVYLLVAVLHRSYCTDMRAVCSGFTVFASLIQSKCVVCTTCLLMFAGNLYDANNIGPEQSDQSS